MLSLWFDCMMSIMHGYQFCRSEDACSYYLILHAQAVACMIIDMIFFVK